MLVLHKAACISDFILEGILDCGNVEATVFHLAVLCLTWRRVGGGVEDSSNYRLVGSCRRLPTARWVSKPICCLWCRFQCLIPSSKKSNIKGMIKTQLQKQ